MPTGRRGGEDAAASVFYSDFPHFAAFNDLVASEVTLFREPRLGRFTETGWSEAKVLGDLPSGISPTAPRLHCWLLLYTGVAGEKKRFLQGNHRSKTYKG